MNSLKPILIVAIVAGVGYGVWNRLNRKPDAPLAANQGWDAMPNVQVDGAGGANWSPGADPRGAAAPGAAPTFPGLTPAMSSIPPAAAPPADQSAVTAPLASVPPFAGPLGADPAAMPADPNSPPLDGAPVGATPDSASLPEASVGGQPSAYPTTDPSTTDPSMTTDPTGYPSGSFATVLETARRELDAGRLAEGLEQLSAWHGSPQLTAAEQQDLGRLLDQVAGTVIYSRSSFSEPPYEVQPGERIEEIAGRYSVPPELLIKINGLEEPQNLRAGEQLKVVRGPFEATLSLERRLLTVWVGKCYAGRFTFGVGRDFPPNEGEYTIAGKNINPECHSANGVIPGGDPSNPLGLRWLLLSGEAGFGLHGTNDPSSIGTPEQGGCIALSPRDIDDLFDMLIVGSRVTISK